MFKNCFSLFFIFCFFLSFNWLINLLYIWGVVFHTKKVIIQTKFHAMQLNHFQSHDYSLLTLPKQTQSIFPGFHYVVAGEQKNAPSNFTAIHTQSPSWQHYGKTGDHQSHQNFPSGYHEYLYNICQSIEYMLRYFNLDQSGGELTNRRTNITMPEFFQLINAAK